MITNLLQGLVVLGYWYLGDPSIFILYAVVLIYSLLNQFYMPAEAAYLPSTVSKTRLAQANSLFFMTSQGAIVFGFGFAGIIQNFIGFEGALVLSSILLFVAFVSTSFLTEIRPKKQIPEKIEHAINTFFKTVIEGYDFIKKNKQILYPLMLLLGVQVGLSILIVSLPVIAEQILEISVEYVGLMAVVPAGLGAVTGSVLIPKLLKKGMRKKKIIEIGLLLISMSGLVLSVGVPFLPFITRIFVTTFLIVFVGFGFTCVNIPTVTFLQANTPSWLRGRVFGNLFFMVTVLTIFPVLFSGTITEIFGVKTQMTIMSLIALEVFIYSVKRGETMIKEKFIPSK